MDTIKEAMRGGVSRGDLQEAVETENRLSKEEAKGYRRAQQDLTADLRKGFGRVVGKYQDRGGLVVEKLYKAEATVPIPGGGRRTILAYEAEDGTLYEQIGVIPHRHRGIDPKPGRAIFWSEKTRRPWLLQQLDEVTAEAVRAASV